MTKEIHSGFKWLGGYWEFMDYVLKRERIKWLLEKR